MTKARSWEPTITVVFISLISTGLSLVGQAAHEVNTGMGDIGQIIANLGVVGTLVWYLYHNTTKTIPDLNDSHNKAVEKLVEIHAENNEKIANQFISSLESERVSRAKELDSLKMWIRSEASCQYHTTKEHHNESH